MISMIKATCFFFLTTLGKVTCDVSCSFKIQLWSYCLVVKGHKLWPLRVTCTGTRYFFFFEINDSVKFPCLTNVFLDWKLVLYPKPVYAGFVMDNVTLKRGSRCVCINLEKCLIASSFPSVCVSFRAYQRDSQSPDNLLIYRVAQKNVYSLYSSISLE